MYCQPECYSCLEDLARRCAALAIPDPAERERVLADALAYLRNNFSLDVVSIGFAAEVQRIIRLKSGNKDPFAAVKSDEIALARKCAERFAPLAQASLRELVQFAAKGNGFDFFQDLSVLEGQFKAPVQFSRDDTGALDDLLQSFRTAGGKKIIYLADNAGECYFDLPLVKRMEQGAAVYYAVKESPVQNDLTAAELDFSGIGEQFTNVVSTGTDSPGLDLPRVSPQFRELMGEADLILGKGMGHYETLTEFSLPQPVFLIFQAKCDPVARTSGLPKQSYAAYFHK